MLEGFLIHNSDRRALKKERDSKPTFFVYIKHYLEAVKAWSWAIFVLASKARLYSTAQ